MILVRCKGGLGNQMFQYAAALALARRHGVRLAIDTSWYTMEPRGDRPTRTFDLGNFRISGEVAGEREARRLGMPAPDAGSGTRGARLRALLRGRTHFSDDAMGLLPRYFRLGPRTNLAGYFQHPEYFSAIAPILRQEFAPRDPPPAAVAEFARHLRATPSVCIQVRRTDFVSAPEVAAVHDCISPDYYRRAWARLGSEGSDLTGYVFTDDQDWAREYFAAWPDVEVLGREWDGPAFLHRFHLMQQCRHHILANSTWGWWAAWLAGRADGRVILPDEWLRGRGTLDLGLVCEGWETESGARA